MTGGENSFFMNEVTSLMIVNYRKECSVCCEDLYLMQLNTP